MENREIIISPNTINTQVSASQVLRGKGEKKLIREYFGQLTNFVSVKLNSLSLTLERLLREEYIYLLASPHRCVLNLSVTLQFQFLLLKHNTARLHA